MNSDRINPRFYPGSPLDDQPHYVYTFWAGKTPLYVGCTNNLRRRMKEHAAGPGLHDAATWIAWVVFPNRESALTAEAERIVKLMPHRNTGGNPGRQTVSIAYANWEAWLAWDAEMAAFIERCDRVAGRAVA